MKQIDVKTRKDSVVITVDGREIVFPKLKGFMQIAELMDHADEEIFCTLLQVKDIKRLWDAERRLGRTSSMYDTENDPIDTYHSFEYYKDHPIMDHAYYKNLQKEAMILIRRIAAAEEYNDIGKAEAYKSELEHIRNSLLGMSKPNKTSRNMPGEHDKSIDAVRKTIAKAINIIGKADLELHQHLKERLKVGKYSCYHSLPGVEVTVHTIADC